MERQFRYPSHETEEFQPVVLMSYGWDWHPLCGPMTDKNLAYSIATGAHACNEFMELDLTGHVAIGVMNSEFYVDEVWSELQTPTRS